MRSRHGPGTLSFLSRIVASIMSCPSCVVLNAVAQGLAQLCMAAAQPEPPGARSFFSEIISSISDLKFSCDGRHLLARDYMTLKLWCAMRHF